MAAHDTTNTQAFIEAQQYSQFILDNLHDGLLPDQFTRDVSDFGSGTTLNIKTVGAATIQEVAEGQALAYNKIDTGNIQLTITDYPGDAWSVSDELREDGAQIEQLLAMRGQESTRAIQEYFESRFLSTAESALVDADPNDVNGFPHRIASSEASNVATLEHFVEMKLSFDKANVPQAGRIAIVDPVVEATLNKLVTQTASVNFNPQFQGIVNEGFMQEHKFVVNIMGWDVYTCNRLPTGDFGDGTTSVTGGVSNIFMNVLDDNTKPIMRAWRRMPRVEGWRENELREDRFQVTSRLGFGAQRVDTLGTLITSASNY